MKQTKPELMALYKSLSGEGLESTLTNDEIIKRIVSVYSLDSVFKKWSKKINAYTTTLCVYKIFKGKQRYKKFMTTALENVDQDVLEALKKGDYKGNLLSKPKLIEVLISENDYYFMYAVKGKKRKILNGLKIQEVVQPSFLILRLDDKNGILEIRGPKSSGERSYKELKKYLNLDGDVDIKQVIVDSKESVLELCKKLKGRPTRAVIEDDAEKELSKAEFVSKSELNVYETEAYKKFEAEGYDDSAGGIDFEYYGKSYTIYVGFSRGTYWFRNGNINEDVIKRVVSAVSKL